MKKTKTPTRPAKKAKGLRRFLLFGYEEHDAGGGWQDLQGDYAYLATAEKAGAVYANKDGRAWKWTKRWHVVDTRTGRVVATNPARTLRQGGGLFSGSVSVDVLYPGTPVHRITSPGLGGCSPGV